MNEIVQNISLIINFTIMFIILNFSNLYFFMNIIFPYTNKKIAKTFKNTFSNIKKLINLNYLSNLSIIDTNKYIEEQNKKINKGNKKFMSLNINFLIIASCILLLLNFVLIIYYKSIYLRSLIELLNITTVIQIIISLAFMFLLQYIFLNSFSFPYYINTFIKYII